MLAAWPAGARIALLPIDDRPATGQFARMIARIAGEELVRPPAEILGRFTVPGDGRKIVAWLEGLDYARLDGLIVSIDMLAYGGLVASRVNDVSLAEAARRLETLRQIHLEHPSLRIYAFNCVMRLAPTGRPDNQAWRRDLQEWAGAVDDPSQEKRADELAARIPPDVLESYLATRRRNYVINMRMIEWVREGVFDFLALSQDDAKPYGLHRPEQLRLAERVKDMNVADRVMIFPGADELGMVLMARLMTAQRNRKPRVAVEFSSEKGKELIDPYEDRPIRETVRLQILATGGQPATADADLWLFVNVPQRTEEELQIFLEKLHAAVNGSRPVAVADVAMLGKNGGPDPALIAYLEKHALLDHLAAFAGWNTTANSLGTALPQAYAWLFSRGRNRTAQTEFLFHRYLNDYGYHVMVRPAIYAWTESEKMARDYVPQDRYEEVNRRASQQMDEFARKFFDQNFRPRGWRLKSLRSYLPWPRLFEIVIEIKLEPTPRRPAPAPASPRTTGQTSSPRPPSP